MIDNLKSQEELEVKKLKVTKADIVVKGNVDKPYYVIVYHEVGKDYDNEGFGSYYLENVFKWRNEELEIVDEKEQPKTDWIPFEEKEADEDEKEAYGCEYMLCCKLPDEDEEILVTYANGNVGEDIFLRDGYECYLDSGNEFVTEAIAWMPKPQPYKKEGATDECR